MSGRIEKLWIFAFCFIFHFTVSGQKNWLATTGGPLQSVELIELDVLISQQIATSRSVDKKDGPFRFAHEIQTKISVQESGTWENLDNGKMLWRQRIKSKGAYSLNLAFKDFQLPSSASMFLYDVDQTHVIGPITQEDNDIHGEWWSPIIPFEEVVVEIQVSPKEAQFLKTTITEVNHDFHGLGALLSGSCNIDVICGEEEGFAIIDQYRDIINSVGMYSINGRDICSGALVNNVRNDCTPYFLTAKHCEVTANNAASVVVYWNYQQTTCRTPGSATSGGIGDGPRNMFNSGIQLLSEFDNSDMALFLLDDPVAPEVDAYFAGWDATGAILDSAICVHHPQAEEKRISFDYEPSVPFFSNQFYRVLDWNEGTTESGSSGAPLFSTDRLIVGQLNGGAASCGNEEYDDFGMVAISWEGGGTPETSLKSWLDPDNTGTLTHGGRSCSDLITVAEPNIQFCTLQSTTAQTTISIQSGYEAGADLSIKSIPSNVSLTFSQGSISPTSPNATVTIELENGYDETSGEIIIAINSNNVEDLLNINFLVDLDVPDAPIPTFPEDGASNVSYDIDLLWEGTALSYQIEIYEVLEQGNQDLVLSETLASREFPIRDLKNNTTYNWRVQGLNSCGEGAFSDYFSFVTGDVSCNLLNDGDLPQSIGTELDTIHSVITVEEVGAVVDVNVLNVRGTHTFVSDLIMEIRSPNGTVVELLSYKCQDADNFSLSFDDDSDIINTPCPLISQNPQRPAGSLSDFTGESAQGEWVLTIYDDVREDGGSFDSWSLEICVLAEDVVERSISILPALVEVCEKTQEGPIEIAGTISGGYGNSVVIEAIGPITDDISITPNPVTGSGSRTFAISIDNIENLPLGSFIQLLASDEMGVDTISIAVAEMETPDMPSLLSPANNLIGEDLKPSFSWNSAALTNSYRVKVGSDETLTNPVLDTVLEGTSVTFSKKLAVDTEYFWSVTAEGTCTNVESEIFMFRTTLIDATRDISLQAIKIYPNPVNFKLSLAVPNHLRNRQLQYEIVNSLGQVQEQKNLSSAITEVDMSNYSAGIYYVKLVSDKGVWTQAVFKL